MPNERMRYGIRTYQYPPGTRPSDTAHKVKKKSFDPDQNDLERAKAEFKKKGGEIVIVENHLGGCEF